MEEGEGAAVGAQAAAVGAEAAAAGARAAAVGAEAAVKVVAEGARVADVQAADEAQEGLQCANL